MYAESQGIHNLPECGYAQNDDTSLYLRDIRPVDAEAASEFGLCHVSGLAGRTQDLAGIKCIGLFIQFCALGCPRLAQFFVEHGVVIDARYKVCFHNKSIREQ